MIFREPPLVNGHRSNIIGCRGQSLLELIVAMAIFSLVGAAMAAMVTGSFAGLEQGGEQTRAEALAQEGIEAVRAIRDRAWNENVYSTSSVAVSGNEWVFSGEGTSETIGQFTRAISFNGVCRGGSGEIVDCPGSYADPHTKEVVSEVSWDTREGVSNTVRRAAYLTNWDSSFWIQTDWSGGSGQPIWSDETKYDTDGGYIATTTIGEIKLKSGDTRDDGFGFPTAPDNDWPFTTAANYTYDSAKVDVFAGYAQLKQSGGTTVSGGTVNSDFDSGASDWTYSDWEVGSVDVTGNWISAGGNSNGYVNVSIPGANGDTSSGFWEQPFTTTADNPSIATTTFDWIVTQFSNNRLLSFQLYVFLDSSSGSPSLGTEIWSSGEITGTTAWTSVPEIDVSSKLGAAGTYYLKIAVRRVTSTGGGPPTGTNTGGFDNVKLHWENTTGGTYPTDKPDIYPASSFFAPGVVSWDNFTETAVKNGGEIYYQLSNDDGTTWQYWNGSAWAAAGAADYNIATVVNTNIGSFTTANEKIKFRAFFESDGSQLVKLDNVNIGFTAPDPVWTFFEWGVDAGEVTPAGNLRTTGGNPGNYVDVSVPFGRADELGGYWEQPFTVYRDGATPVTVDFDYKVVDFNGSPIVADVRVYIDASSGDPVNQVGGSIGVTAEGSWTSAATIDAAAAVPAAGVYYLKIAFWVETPARGGGAGPFTVGFDNVNLELGNGEYPASGSFISSAFDTGASSKIQVAEWDETIPSCSPACEIKLELNAAPDSGGSPGAWTGWYGAGGAGTYFATSTGSLVPTALNGNQWVRYRATFTGDGMDTPILTETRVNYK